MSADGVISHCSWTIHGQSREENVIESQWDEIFWKWKIHQLVNVIRASCCVRYSASRAFSVLRHLQWRSRMFRLQCFHLCTTLIVFISYIILYCMYYFCEWKLVHHRYFSTEFFLYLWPLASKKFFAHRLWSWRSLRY